jgi:hypothetical protein
MSPDGRSFLTSVGATRYSVWIHDSQGERQISSEGDATLLGSLVAAPRSAFSRDGKRLYYLVLRQACRAFGCGELWVTELASGRSERLAPGFLITGCDISADERRVVFAALDQSGRSSIWLASIDRSVPPRRLPFVDADSPNFGPAGELLFRAVEGRFNFLYRAAEDGAMRQKALRDPIDYLLSVSPDRQSVIVEKEMGDMTHREVVAHSLAGGAAIRVCEDCMARWASDGRWLYIRFYGYRDGRQPSGLWGARSQYGPANHCRPCLPGAFSPKPSSWRGPTLSPLALA